MNQPLVIDLECWVDWDYIHDPDRWAEFERTYGGAPANYRDPVKVAAHQTEWHMKRRKAWTFSPLTARVCSIAWGYLWEEEVASEASENEAAVIERFSRAVWDHPSTLTGYNVRRFDVPFLQVRASVLGIALPPWWPHERDYRGIADLMDVTGEGKLDQWLDRCGIALKTGDGAMVEYMSIDQIEEYNRHDIIVERQLAQRFAPNMPQMRNTNPATSTLQTA